MKLVVVWKSNNDIDINNFIIPYAYNSKKLGWFDEVEVLIWGASQEKVMTDEQIQDKVAKLVSNSIPVYACKMCSDNIGATEMLENIGVNVIYTGVYLSDNLKNPNCKVITL